ncbi:helix-turn-helix domain-containing protein [Streptomyces sp. V4-01]|uniref:Helix-turn-helix domain-containing protein n=1 Tax=Actinacidiphila polyblastidii TaxID=3110430 RepID=A0ABU7PMN7_9ACTN|nr:helix-turn-helix domain-containing protein [Streptomyces sp. V4-01]
MSAREAAFGTLLRELRRERSLTIEALAEASGVSVRGISDLERGRRSAPRQRTVAALADGLGLDGTDRAQLHAAAVVEGPSGFTPVGVSSFPRGTEDFVGRADELWRLETLAGAVGTGDGAGAPGSDVAADVYASPVVVAIHGAPGAGKTALASRAARHLADRFPDGQLMVDLMGTDNDPPAPAELMVRVLKAVGVPDRELAQAGALGRPALYRQVLAGRCCLLVLDNARDEAQVRPLLPSAGRAFVVVTSRRMLTGLDDVHRLQLGRLSPAESAVFLTSLVGEERACADPEAVEDVGRLCGHLPLALRVAGNLLATRSGWSVRRLAERLAHEERRLEVLSAGDVRVGSAFELSYRQLTPSGARLFRRLALVPAPDMSAACAAQLTGQSLYDTEDALEELVEAGLLDGAGERYRLHDLLALYARIRLTSEESAEEIERSRAAMFRWLLDTAAVAGRWYEPGHDASAPPVPGTVDLSTVDKARDWLQTEAANWLAAVHAAAANGDHAAVVDVVAALQWFADHWMYWGHWAEVFGVSARSAQALGDPLLEATHLNFYAWALGMCEERFQDSLRCSAQALTAARLAGDTLQQAWAHSYAGWAHRFLGDGERAVADIAAAAELFQAAGYLPGMLTALQQRAMTLRDIVDDQEAAIAVFHEVLARADEFEEQIGSQVASIYRCNSLAGQGGCYSRLKRWDDAVRAVEASVELSRSVGNTAMEGRYLIHLGDALSGAGRSAEARAVFEQCAALGPDAGTEHIAEARSRLAAFDVG